jgi:hypothetical protein
MQEQTVERWQQLCALAIEERDLDKVLEIVKEINRLLEEKEQRLKKARSYTDSQTTPQA